MTATSRQDFDATVLPLMDELYRAALRLSRSPADAEDLVQEAVLRAWSYWDRFQTGTNGRAWMHRIVLNTFINGYRKKKREREILQRAKHEPAKAPLRLLPGEKLSDEVSAALAGVPETFRVAVLLVDIGDMSYKEAADSLGCPIGTIMSRLHRGRRILQDSLSSYAAQEGYISEAVAA